MHMTSAEHYEEIDFTLEVSVTPALLLVDPGSRVYIYCVINAF